MAVFKYKASDGSWKTILSDGGTSSWEDITDKPTFAEVATSGDYSDLNNKPTIPTKTSDLDNDSGFLTEHQDISNLATKTELSGKVDKVAGKQLSTEDFTSALKTKLEGLSNYDDTAIQEAVSGLQTQLNTLVSGDASTAIESFNEIIAFLDGLEDTEDLASIIASIEQQIASKYTKPSTGIPKSDLDSAVQTSLGKADTALQEHQSLEDYVKDADLAEVATSGSYTDLSNKPTIPNALADLSADASHRTVTDTEKATWNAKSNFSGSYNDLTNKPTIPDISGKQDKLVSGTNIKTINGISLLGSGNIVISGGGGGGGSSAYSEVSHGTSDTTFTLTPNVFHIWDEVSSLTLTLGDETAGVANEFLFQFNSGATATTLTLPNDIKWANDSAPTIEANMIYQISILKGLASVLVFDNAPQVSLITFSILSFEAQAEAGMTWGEWTTSSYNTLNCAISGSYILRYGSFVALNGVYVTTSDLIIANTRYNAIMPDM